MTITKKYYEALIMILERLTVMPSDEVVAYLQLKKELNDLIQRILKFDLFPLTFSPEIMVVINNDRLKDLSTEKLQIIDELQYELIECLDITRLRYGGELLKYLLRIQIAIIRLPLLEFNIFKETIKKSSRFTIQYPDLTDEAEQKNHLSTVLTEFNKQPKFPDPTTVLKETFEVTESQLKKIISEYEEYAVTNYPTLADQFPFVHKKVRGYLTQAMSKHEFEFRIYAYDPIDGNRTTTIAREYYDFCGAYFYNLEEFTEKKISALVIGLNKQSLSLGGILDKSYIHHELIYIFTKMASESEMECFVEFLLKNDGYFISQTENKKAQFDMLVRKHGEYHQVNIYHKKMRSLRQLSQQIKSFDPLPKHTKALFIFTTELADEDSIELLKTHNIEYKDIWRLCEKYFTLNNTDVLHWYISSRLSYLKMVQDTPSLKFDGEQLIKELKNCPPGENSWSAYEKIGIDVFRFLFADNFKQYLTEEQISNDMKNHRRDLLVNNNFKDATSFWAEVKTAFEAQIIIIDFKNYSKKLNSNDFFTVSKYAKKGVGRFAVVFSRFGIDATARQEQKTLYDNGKLLIEFTDEDLIQMIHEKIMGKDPIDRLDSKKFQLVKLY